MDACGSDDHPTYHRISARDLVAEDGRCRVLSVEELSRRSAGDQGGPERVGPYRVLGRLGQGGMGEVWAGFDDRLDRPVALKRVRTARTDDPEARERLRREARAVAGLRHLAVVQVYDWVESPHGDWIVMEQIEGVSLRHLLLEGPLEPARAIRLALDILSGLAAAHAAGIVHRDLKASNVMLTTDSGPGHGERAKLLDFGIAKRLEAGSPPSLDSGAIGTVGAMSPERVRGLEVGPRSDLFSLGSLLYEMVTGRPPFHAEGPGESLRRICTWDPPDPHGVNPAISDQLSSFILRLLAKDPRARPDSAESAFQELEAILEQLDHSQDTWLQTLDDLKSLVPAEAGSGASGPEGAAGSAGRRSCVPWRWAVASTVLVLAAAVALWQMQRSKPPLYVAVPATVTQRIAPAAVEPGMPAGGADSDLELAARAVHTAVLRGLLGFRRLVVLEPAGDAPEDPRSLARATASEEVFATALTCGEQSCHLILERIRGSDGQLLWTQGFPVESTHLLEVSQAVADHLQSAFPEKKLRPGVPELEVRAADYADYLEAQRRFDRREAGFSLDDLLTELQRLERSSPRFLELPYFEAHVLVRYFQENRNEAYLARARLALARAEALAPADPRVLYEKINIARISGDIEEAEQHLAALRRLEPGNVRASFQQARLLERQGRRREALALMARVVEKVPAASFYFDYGGMLGRAGEIDSARQALLRGLERSPGHYNGLSRLAQLELMSGVPARAVDLYSQLVRRSPEATELINLGTAHLLVGEYPAAAESFETALQMSPASPAARLNLADAKLLGGEVPEALRHYSEVLAAVEGDPEPEKWATVRAQALARLSKPAEAVAAIQEVLRLRPDDPMTAYEASLVYCIVGDETSAAWHGRRALERGIDRRWFTFPWFDPIRAELQSAAAAPSGPGQD